MSGTARHDPLWTATVYFDANGNPVEQGLITGGGGGSTPLAYGDPILFQEVPISTGGVFLVAAADTTASLRWIENISDTEIWLFLNTAVGTIGKGLRLPPYTSGVANAGLSPIKVLPSTTGVWGAHSAGSPKSVFLTSWGS